MATQQDEDAFETVRLEIASIRQNAQAAREKARTDRARKRDHLFRAKFFDDKADALMRVLLLAEERVR